MKNKKWYTVSAECIKKTGNISALVGDKIVLGKITSKMNALIFYNSMKNVYSEENWILTIE